MARAPARLSLRCVPFARFEAEVADACGGTSEATQVAYLKTYLADESMGATWIVVEYPYVDRHYLEEFAGYYASGLQAPPNKTTRLHFFRRAADDDALARAIAHAASDGVDAASRALTADYLGFTVIRPLPAAPIGRTVLRPYPGDSSRVYEPALTQHRVHLCGLTLRVRALPFQQQDQAVGACATTALWSALSRTVRADGGRAPTPLAVTRAATEFAVTGRGLPAADGLELHQMLAAEVRFRLRHEHTTDVPSSRQSNPLTGCRRRGDQFEGVGELVVERCGAFSRFSSHHVRAASMRSTASGSMRSFIDDARGASR